MRPHSPRERSLEIMRRGRIYWALFVAAPLVVMVVVSSLGGGGGGGAGADMSARLLGVGARAGGGAGRAGGGGGLRGDPCAFQYAGPLRPESMDCFMEYFPAKVPFYRPAMAANRSFSLGGIQWESGPAPVPIFVLFKDRVSVLMETLRSFWRHIGTPYELIIFNDNTTFPAAVNFLQRLRESGVKVHDNKRAWSSFDELYEIVADFVEAYMTASGSSYFVLTDPDCALDSSPWNLLFVYQAALEGLGVDVVGAALRWDDYPETMEIPRENWDNYHQYYELEYAKLPSFAFKYNELNYYYMNVKVDSTFAIYRKGTRLHRLRLKKYIRMLPPLGARHLDFYLQKNNLPEDYKYYHAGARAKAVNHMKHLDEPSARGRRERDHTRKWNSQSYPI